MKSIQTLILNAINETDFNNYYEYDNPAEENIVKG